MKKIVLFVSLFLQGCLFGRSLTGYQEADDLGKLSAQVQQLIANPPGSGSGWIYALTGIALTGGVAYVKHQYFPGKATKYLRHVMTVSPVADDVLNAKPISKKEAALKEQLKRELQNEIAMGLAAAVPKNTKNNPGAS